MMIDTQELARVAAVPQHAADAAAPRVNLYAGIHKALRALMADTLMGVGRMDTDDDLELAQACHRVLELLDFCASHLRHENDFVHAAMEARAPGASDLIAHEHEEHMQAIEALNGVVAGLLAATPAQRPAAAHDLYLKLSVFVGHNYEHMRDEETEHNAVLWSHYTDAELVDIHQALVASIPPDEMMYVMRWLVPFMNPAERAGLLADMKAHAPAPAFDAVIDTLRPHLTAHEWSKLARAIGLPIVPGLMTA